jgi:hypothetical protein
MFVAVSLGCATIVVVTILTVATQAAKIVFLIGLLLFSLCEIMGFCRISMAKIRKSERKAKGKDLIKTNFCGQLILVSGKMFNFAHNFFDIYIIII